MENKLPKASEILEVNSVDFDGNIVHFIVDADDLSKGLFETKEQAETLLSKWDSVESLEAENARLLSLLKSMKLQFYSWKKQNPETFGYKWAMEFEAIEETTKVKKQNPG